MTVKKDKMRQYFLEMYHKLGFEKAKNEAIRFMEESASSARAKHGDRSYEALTVFRGELAEIILEIGLQEYMKHNPNSFYVKNLCIKKPRQDGEGNKLKKQGWSDYTELDVTLFTEGRVYLFECKSYAGQKTLTETCTIVRKGKDDFDVHGQSLAHLNHFRHYVMNQVIRGEDGKPKQTPFKLVFFEVSLQDTIDKRDSKSKDRMPYITIDTLLDYLKKQNNEKIWDLQKLLPVVQKLDKTSKENMTKHLNQLVKMKEKSKVI